MAGNQALAVQNKEVVNQVESRVSDWVKTGKLNLPEDYSVHNAMKQSLLKLQEVKDKNGRSVLEVCDRNSIANALLSMAVQGLTPNKNQCYFIVYGNQLQLQRSYFGTMAVTKRFCPEIADITADVVYAKDKFTFAKKRGRTVITEHISRLENIDKNQIVAAYCSIFYKDGTEQTTIMTLDQIKQAWQMNRYNNPINQDGSLKANTTHGKFTEEMAKKTVINRACKTITNSSNDGSILAHYIHAADQDREYAEQQEIVEAETASIVIDDYEVNADTGEVVLEPEHVPEAEPQIEEEPEVTEQIETAEFDDDPGY